jgi:hypothetical protein
MSGYGPGTERLLDAMNALLATIDADTGYLRPNNNIAYGRIEATGGAAKVESGVTFDNDTFVTSVSDTTDNITITVPDGSRVVQITTDGDAGKLIAYVDGSDLDGTPIAITADGTTTIPPAGEFDFNADEALNVITLTMAGTHGATYINVVAYGLAV